MHAADWQDKYFQSLAEEVRRYRDEVLRSREETLDIARTLRHEVKVHETELHREMAALDAKFHSQLLVIAIPVVLALLAGLVAMSV